MSKNFEAKKVVVSEIEEKIEKAQSIVIVEYKALTVDDDGFLHLTAIGREIAEKIYERHLFFMEQLIVAGVDQETAEQDACRIEHAISDTSFRKLKEKVQGTD